MLSFHKALVFCLCAACVASLPSDENFCELVSSRGILLSCDVQPKKLESDSVKLSLIRIQSHLRGNKAISDVDSAISFGAKRYLKEIAAQGDGVTVYVTTKALPAFVEQVLPRIQTKFTLITGDSDQGPIQTLKSKQAFDSLVNNPYLIKWFGQNAVDGEEKHPKFVQLPIGLDYHTLKVTSTSWGPKATPLEQETLLMGKRHASLAFENRSAKLFFAGQSDNSRRDKVMHSGAVEYHAATDRSTFWSTAGSHRFVVSPPGNGIDCHRTWEAFAMGSIPIVSDRLHTLYKTNGLNVVSLSDEEWGQLSSPAVQKKMRYAASHYRKEMPEAMYLKYWTDKIRNSKDQSTLLRVTV